MSPIVEVLYKQILAAQEATELKWGRQKKTGIRNGSNERWKYFLNLAYDSEQETAISL